MEPIAKVLVVDDGRINREFLTRFLSPGHKVMVAKSGEQALKAASRAEGKPDLIPILFT